MDVDSLRKFLKTDDRNVVSIMKQYQEDSEKFVNDCALMNHKYNVKFMGSVNPDGAYVANYVKKAEHGEPRLPGKWTKPNSSGFIYPYKNNKEGNDLLKSLTLPAPELPGIRMSNIEDSEKGGSYFCYTSFFLFRDEVWVSVGRSMEVESPEWKPVKHWEYEKALEELKEEERSDNE